MIEIGQIWKRTRSELLNTRKVKIIGIVGDRVAIEDIETGRRTSCTVMRFDPFQRFGFERVSE